MNDCIFCKFATREIKPNEVIDEDEYSLSFLDIHPVNPGHVLIIPKTHFPKLIETPDEFISKLFIKAKELMPAIQKATQADFVVLTVVGTDVPHFHIHLIPRFNTDGLHGFWPSKNYEHDDEMHTIGKKIREHLN